ncbi:MAG: hypothetical protein JWM07_25 [Candidatus Saccharibacteria bacterium]|nr:hypothetical protein [Candidatus Saccharibacteria bacterium]
MGKAEEVLTERWAARDRWKISTEEAQVLCDNLREEIATTLAWLEANNWPDTINDHVALVQNPTEGAGLTERRAMWFLGKIDGVEFCLDSIGKIWMASENTDFKKRIVELANLHMKELLFCAQQIPSICTT